MNKRPVLQLYVLPGCGSCQRAERAMRGCDRLRLLVDLEVLELGAPGAAPCPGVIGVPTVVFEGKVVALGTPDCEELAGRIAASLRGP